MEKSVKPRCCATSVEIDVGGKIVRCCLQSKRVRLSPSPPPLLLSSPSSVAKLLRLATEWTWRVEGQTVSEGDENLGVSRVSTLFLLEVAIPIY